MFADIDALEGLSVRLGREASRTATCGELLSKQALACLALDPSQLDERIGEAARGIANAAMRLRALEEDMATTQAQIAALCEGCREVDRDLRVAATEALADMEAALDAVAEMNTRYAKAMRRADRQRWGEAMLDVREMTGDEAVVRVPRNALGIVVAMNEE